MNTDKIYAEQLANEYAPKDKGCRTSQTGYESKTSSYHFCLYIWNYRCSGDGYRDVFFYECNWQWNEYNVCAWCDYWNYRVNGNGN